jgi:hypothetical protein
MILCAATLAVLLVIGGVEQNPGPGVEVENTVQVLCSGCERSLKWEHNVTRVAVGFITAVEMLRHKWRRAGSGTVIGVKGKGFVY